MSLFTVFKTQVLKIQVWGVGGWGFGVGEVTPVELLPPKNKNKTKIKEYKMDVVLN